MLLALSNNECVENHMKLFLNTHLQFIKNRKIKDIGVIWELDAI